MDVEEYRRRYTAEVEADERAAAARQGRGARRRRQAALDGAEEPGRRVLATVGDTAQPADTRIAAIDQVRIDATSHQAVITALLVVLQDAADDPAVRRAALGALRENSFRVADFSPYAADFRSALRSVATGPDRGLREAALEILALEGDEYAQRMLVEGLTGERRALIPAQRALQFLGYDLHAEHYGMLRELVGTAKNPAVRNGALRLLAADADAKDMFARIVQDRTEDIEARTLSAAALNSLAPDEFAPLAREIVLDETDDDDLRATCLTALSHGTGQDLDPALAERVMAAPTKPSRQLARAARQYTAVVAGGDG